MPLIRKPYSSICWVIVALLAPAAGGDRAAEQPQATTATSGAAPAFLSGFGLVGESAGKSELKAVVCLFTRTDCPVSNSYAPEVRRKRRADSGADTSMVALARMRTLP